MCQSHTYREVLIDVVEKHRMDTLQVRNVDKLAELDPFMVAVSQRIVGSSTPIKLMAHFIKCYIENLNDKCRLQRISRREERTD